MGAVVERKAKDEPTNAVGADSDLLAKHKLLLKMAGDPALTKADVAIGAYLLERFNAERGYAWPSEAAIAKSTEQCERTVRRSIARLTAGGYFAATKSERRGNAKTYCPDLSDWTSVSGPTGHSCPTNRTSVSKIPDSNVRPYQLEDSNQETRQETISLPSVAERAREVQPDFFSVEVEAEELPLEGKEARAPTSQPTPRNPKAVGDARATDLGAAAFEEWWFAFPAQRRVAKDKCANLYAKIVKAGKATPAILLTAARDYAASDDVARGFAVNPYRWLSEERWTVLPTQRSQRRGSLLEAALAAVRECESDDLVEVENA
jgi:hypothetical protein